LSVIDIWKASFEESNENGVIKLEPVLFFKGKSSEVLQSSVR